MENTVEAKTTESKPLNQSMSKKIGKCLRATHYKLGIDSNYIFFNIFNI